MPVSAKISPNETMMDGDIARYLSVGEDALRAIHAVPGLVEPRSILDLPCGHGRVARHLRVAYPVAELFVADLDEPGAEFCEAEFDATKLQSTPRFSEIDFGRKFDLIWVGSLITHLDSQATSDFFDFLSRHLTDQGSAVVTSHGSFVAGRLFLSERPLYGLSLEAEAGILADYMRTGYGYNHYPMLDGYGVSVVSRRWIRDAAGRAGLSVVSHEDHAWDNHQDVVVLRHAANSPRRA
jgi:SAM-dependent methyltransferase